MVSLLKLKPLSLRVILIYFYHNEVSVSLSSKLKLEQKANEFWQRCFKGNKPLSFRCLIIVLHYIEVFAPRYWPRFLTSLIENLLGSGKKQNKLKKKKLLTPRLLRRSASDMISVIFYDNSKLIFFDAERLYSFSTRERLKPQSSRLGWDILVH